MAVKVQQSGFKDLGVFGFRQWKNSQISAGTRTMEKVPLVDGGVERFTLPGAWVLMLTLQHHNRRQHTVLRMYACMHACVYVFICIYTYIYIYTW